VTSILMPLVHGAESHLMDIWEPREGLERIAKFRCTASVTTTAFLQTLLTVYDPDQHDANSLRCWTSAGAPIPGAFVAEAQRTLPRMKVLSLYGRSENLCTTGRLKDIVIRGGLNISVRQVEDLLIAHPAVSAVAAVGMPDAVLGERVCCYLVPAPGAAPLTLADMREYLLGEGLAIQKVPERVEVVTELPTTATGKIQKNLLRADIAAKLAP
jgi:acyl-CoA synthetase (AMP-forming)/AMP-acid ligase II